MHEREAAAGPREFPDTRWSRVIRERADPAKRRELLQELCRTRWHPLYVYARRRGLPADRAEDVVQGVLLQLTEHDFIDRLDPARGRLRGYLKRALAHYLSNLAEHESAAKRGGGATPVSLSLVEAEIGAAPTDPEAAFDREWALGVFEGALDDLEREYASGERRGPLAVLRQLFRFGEAPPYEELARTHGMSVSQLKSFVHRGRQRFRALVVARITDTVESPEEAELELSELLRALRS